MTCNECMRVECPYRGMVTVCPNNLITQSGTNTEVIGIPSDNLGGSAVNWRQVRIQAAIAAMQGITSSAHMMSIVQRNAEEADNYIKKSLSEMAVRFADALIEELKKED